GHVVSQAQVSPGDRHETQHDRRCLRDLPAVRPLHALELGPAGANERQRAVAASQRCPRWPLAIAVARPAIAAIAAHAATDAAVACGGRLLYLKLVICCRG